MGLVCYDWGGDVMLTGGKGLSSKWCHVGAFAGFEACYTLYPVYNTGYDAEVPTSPIRFFSFFPPPSSIMNWLLNLARIISSSKVRLPHEAAEQQSLTVRTDRSPLTSCIIRP